MVTYCVNVALSTTDGSAICSHNHAKPEELKYLVSATFNNYLNAITLEQLMLMISHYVLWLNG